MYHYGLSGSVHEQVYPVMQWMILEKNSAVFYQVMCKPDTGFPIRTALSFPCTDVPANFRIKGFFLKDKPLNKKGEMNNNEVWIKNLRSFWCWVLLSPS